MGEQLNRSGLSEVIGESVKNPVFPAEVTRWVVVVVEINCVLVDVVVCVSFLIVVSVVVVTANGVLVLVLLLLLRCCCVVVVAACIDAACRC